jgi:hypothetical protein
LEDEVEDEVEVAAVALLDVVVDVEVVVAVEEVLWMRDRLQRYARPVPSYTVLRVKWSSN